MIAAGLFFQLSNLQAMSQDALKDAINQIGLDNMQPKSMERSDAKSFVTSKLGKDADPAVADSIALYLSKGSPSVNASSTLFSKDKNVNPQAVTAAVAELKNAPAKGEMDDTSADKQKQNDAAKKIQAQVRDYQSKKEAHKAPADAEAAQADAATQTEAPASSIGTDSRAKVDELKSQLAQAHDEADSHKKVSAELQAQLAQAAEETATAKEQAANHKENYDNAIAEHKKELDELSAAARVQISQTNSAAKDAKAEVAQLKAQLDKMINSDQSIKDLVDAAKNGTNDDKFVPLTEKAANSLSDAINLIPNPAQQALARSIAIGALSKGAPAVSAKAPAKGGHNMGRLGKNKKHRA